MSTGKLFFMMPMLWALFACSSPPDSPQPEPNESRGVESSVVAVPCPEPRPRSCPANDAPVCAIRDTGIRCMTFPCPSSEYREYPNACEACADPKVRSWLAGPCSNNMAVSGK